MRRQVLEFFGQDAIIVDVRSPGEFRNGANPKSVNIPLDELQRRLSELDPRRPTILCCASGARSGTAVSLLRRAGFKKVINAGAWQNTLLSGGGS
jgi:phage shock protein E